MQLLLTILACCKKLLAIVRAKYPLWMNRDSMRISATTKEFFLGLWVTGTDLEDIIYLQNHSLSGDSSMEDKLHSTLKKTLYSNIHVELFGTTLYNLPNIMLALEN